MEIGRVARIMILSDGYEPIKTDPCSTRKDLDESLRRNIRLVLLRLDEKTVRLDWARMSYSFAGSFGELMTRIALSNYLKFHRFSARSG